MDQSNHSHRTEKAHIIRLTTIEHLLNFQLAHDGVDGCIPFQSVHAVHWTNQVISLCPNQHLISADVPNLCGVSLDWLCRPNLERSELVRP